MLTATNTAADATVEARMGLSSRLYPDFLHFWILTVTQDMDANVGITRTEDFTSESALVEGREAREASEARQREPGPVLLIDVPVHPIVPPK